MGFRRIGFVNYCCRVGQIPSYLMFSLSFCLDLLCRQRCALQMCCSVNRLTWLHESMRVSLGAFICMESSWWTMLSVRPLIWQIDISPDAWMCKLLQILFAFSCLFFSSIKSVFSQGSGVLWFVERSWWNEAIYLVKETSACLRTYSSQGTPKD